MGDAGAVGIAEVGAWGSEIEGLGSTVTGVTAPGGLAISILGRGRSATRNATADVDRGKCAGIDGNVSHDTAMSVR